MAGDFPTITYEFPSASANGNRIPLTASADNLFHTATASATSFDDVEIYIGSTSASTVNVTLKIATNTVLVAAIDPGSPAVLIWRGRVNNSLAIELNPDAAGLTATGKVNHAVNN